MEERILGKNALLRMLSELENYESDEEDMLTAYITPQNPSLLLKLPDSIRDFIEKILPRHPLGIVLFHWQQKNISTVIFPPFPIVDETFFDRKFKTDQLREIFEREYKLGIILLSLGEYAIGIFESKKLIASKCGKRFLRGKHKKGGSSQARFARARKANIEIFFNEVYGILKGKMEPHISNLDYVIYGGVKITIRNFQKRDHFMKKLSEKTLDRIIDVHDISKKVLEDILFEVWRTRILQL